MDTEATTAGDDHAPRQIGTLLGQARLARGLELVDIARDTRVPVRHLAAIEADDHEHLPALPYAIGFVKAFARAVGVDPEMAGARFRSETDRVAHVPQVPAMTPLDERRVPPRGVVAASVAALLVVIGLVAAWSAGVFDRAPPPAVATAAAPPPAETPTTAPATTSETAAPATADGGTAATPAQVAPATIGATTPVTTAPTTTIAAAPAAAPAAVAVTPGASSGVVITASEDAWFKVSVYDATTRKVVTVKTGVLARGERYTPPPTPGLRLWTGRAGALAITVDGRAVPPLGGPVETVKNVSLDASDLRARLAPAAAGAPR